MGAQSTDTAQGLCPILKSIVALEFVASDIRGDSEGNRQQTGEHETESRIEREMTRQVDLTFSDGKWISPSFSFPSFSRHFHLFHPRPEHPCRRGNNN